VNLGAGVGEDIIKIIAIDEHGAALADSRGLAKAAVSAAAEIAEDGDAKRSLGIDPGT
jgi:hypothetical protein